jgi:hypothetical protein
MAPAIVTRAQLTEAVYQAVDLARIDAPDLVNTVISQIISAAVRPIRHRFQNPCDGMRSARLKREDAFSHAMIIVSSAMVSSS